MIEDTNTINWTATEIDTLNKGLEKLVKKGILKSYEVSEGDDTVTINVEYHTTDPEEMAFQLDDYMEDLLVGIFTDAIFDFSDGRGVEVEETETGERWSFKRRV